MEPIEKSSSSSTRGGSLGRFSLKGVMKSIAGALLALMLLLHVARQRYQNFQAPDAGSVHKLSYSDAVRVTGGDRRFVVVVPASHPGVDLCKTVTSAIALGYPSPIIVSWGSQRSSLLGSHLGKISGTLDYLDAATREDAPPGDKLRDDDMVLVVDGYDIWFQLPPEVLLRRYHESNKRANYRLFEEWGGPDCPMKQTIILSTQKRCYPPADTGSKLHCDVLPQSSLRPDLYGDRTDVNPEDTPNDIHNVRPRFLNSGSIMGPVGHMKRYFRRAKAKLDDRIAAGIYTYSDQGIFGEVFGEQEIWRRSLREHHTSPLDSTDDEATMMMQESFEYNVGLDYSQDMFTPTVFEEDDGDIISLNNRTTIERYSEQLGISPVRLTGIPDDIAVLRYPLADVHAGSGDWGELPLYADFFTTAVPVVLHHRAHDDGRKARRVTWWDRTWFFPHLRELLSFHLKPTKLAPLARLPAWGPDVVYWAPESNAVSKTVRVSTPETPSSPFRGIEFAALCRAEDDGGMPGSYWYQELFRDGKGPI